MLAKEKEKPSKINTTLNSKSCEINKVIVHHFQLIWFIKSVVEKSNPVDNL